MRPWTAIATLVVFGALPARAEFQLSPGDGADHSHPAVCRQPQGFVAAWESDGAGDRDVLFQRLDDTGRAIGTPQRANRQASGDQQLPDVACRADGGFLVVWESRGQDGDGLGVFARGFGADGAPAGDELQVNVATADNQRRPRVCFAPGGDALVVWDGVVGGGTGAHIFARRLGADGLPAGDELTIDDQAGRAAGEPVVACAADGRSLIGWTGQLDNGSDVRVRLLDADGRLDSRTLRVSDGQPGRAQHPAVTALPSGDYGLAMENSQANIALARVTYGGDGSAEVLHRPLYFEKRDEAPAIAADAAGNVLVAWSQGSGFDFSLVGARTDEALAPDRVVALAQANSPGSPPDPLVDAGGLGAASGRAAGNDGALFAVGRGIAIAEAPDGDLVLWQRRDVFAADSTSAIFAQRFADCIGDCSGDRLVGVNELIRGVRIALELASADLCASIDGDGNGKVEIGELIRAVREALAGACPAPVD